MTETIGGSVTMQGEPPEPGKEPVNLSRIERKPAGPRVAHTKTVTAVTVAVCLAVVAIVYIACSPGTVDADVLKWAFAIIGGVAGVHNVATFWQRTTK